MLIQQSLFWGKYKVNDKVRREEIDLRMPKALLRTEGKKPQRNTNGKMCKGDALSSGKVGTVDGQGLLPDFNVIGWEKSISPPAHASPPALINHLNVGDDVIGVKRDFIVTSSLIIVQSHSSHSKVLSIIIRLSVSSLVLIILLWILVEVLLL